MSPAALARMKKPEKRSAFVLWKSIESKFSPPAESQKCELLGDIRSVKSSGWEGDEEYMRWFQEAWARLDYLGFSMLESTAFSMLRNGVSKQLKDIIFEMEMAWPGFNTEVDLGQQINAISSLLQKKNKAKSTNEPPKSATRGREHHRGRGGRKSGKGSG